MPNHWHFVQPTEDGGMSNFMCWVNLDHTMRYRALYHTAGEVHVYRGRFKSFPVQDDDHFHVLCRYVERNAQRAELVERAEDWRWGLCTVGFSRVNLGHGYCPLGRCPVRPTGFAVSTNRSTTRNSMLFAGRSGGVAPSI